MKIMICIKKKSKVKIFGSSKTLDLLIILSSISKAVVERLQREKGMGEDESVKFITECISESYGQIERGR